MPNSQLTIVVSAGQSRNPEKRQLEDEIANQAAELSGVSCLRIPHLYDLAPKGASYESLKEVTGAMVVLSWLYDRAAHWILDRNGVRGQVGEVLLKQDEDDEDEEANEVSEDNPETMTDMYPRPQRRIYCIDFRAGKDVSQFLEEISRIAECEMESAEETTHLTLESLQRFEEPTNDTYVGAPTSPAVNDDRLLGTPGVVTVDEHPGRRWYPVIDFSRCTNCMECIDFCLFGVYGVDSVETIVVEQADNCRKGCPACSRVCPQNAIIFPQHKTPAIAGAPVDTGGLKIDLSKLFGAPESDEDPAEIAARERDEQLILAGREAVGSAGGSTGLQERIAKSQAAESNSSEAKALDGLIDELDSLDL